MKKQGNIEKKKKIYHIVKIHCGSEKRFIILLFKYQ